MTFDDYNYDHYNQHILVMQGDRKVKVSHNLLKSKNLIRLGDSSFRELYKNHQDSKDGEYSIE
jgi:hypothetical protein